MSDSEPRLFHYLKILLPFDTESIANIVAHLRTEAETISGVTLSRSIANIGLLFSTVSFTVFLLVYASDVIEAAALLNLGLSTVAVGTLFVLLVFAKLILVLAKRAEAGSSIFLGIGTFTLHERYGDAAIAVLELIAGLLILAPLAGFIWDSYGSLLDKVLTVVFVLGLAGLCMAGGGFVASAVLTVAPTPKRRTSDQGDQQATPGQEKH